jgi:chitin synthase
MIFICSTMYRENEVEMKQMLVSILNMATHYEAETRKGVNNDKYESHIFFDGAIVAGKIENYGLQLLSLVESTLKVELKNAVKMETPYGCSLTWDNVDAVKMPFVIHFKDKTLVKPKKRWSQVMYMNYVLKYLTEEKKLDHAFILTTDADIDFEASSVVVLLDVLATNTNIAAVCARTHPKGSGLMYWYQLFDYAIGHWFQKPAEHILGSVLCSPGCFSVFRCSALKQVLDEYSTEATSGSEFLMKDMGEDRWLCTLLIKKGFRLEYCALSEDQTYCPTEFEEFFKQRRRWIPSTLANLLMLVSEFKSVTKGNDSISILYLLFQLAVIFSTAISPATVILIISAGMETFNIPFTATVTILSFISVLYGLICLYASPKTQLDVSKILTFVFALIMALTLVGLTRNIIDDVVGDQEKIPLGPGDCSQFDTGNKSTEYHNCLKGHDYAANLTNGLYTPFRLRVSITTIYITVLAGTFLIAGVLHFKEMYCLLHSFWYLLGLPSGEFIVMRAWPSGE